MNIEAILRSMIDLQTDVAEALRHARRETLNAKLSAAVAEQPADAIQAMDSTAVGVGIDRPALVLKTAREQWERAIREPTPSDPAGADAIDHYIRGALGLGWNTCDIVNWTPGVRYTRNGMFAWCGAFAAFCYGVAGLRGELRAKHFAGTPRLYKWAKGTGRFIAKAADLQPGDIAVVGAAGDRDGAHITLVTEVRQGYFSTFEGNAHGFFPDDSKGEGVVCQERPFDHRKPETYRFAFGVRPLPEDYGPQ